VWDLFDDYFGTGRANPLVRGAAAMVRRSLQRWDRRTAGRVERFVACSNHIRDRVRRVYGRDADVVYPPVDVAAFHGAARRDDFYLTVSALVPYKRVDVAVEAFNRMGKPLVVVGEGSNHSALRRQAGPTVELRGRIGQAELVNLYSRCQGFVFCAEEDFGIAPVEAQAAGAPVIAFGRGGCRETVRDARTESEPTGILYDPQHPDALIAAVEQFEASVFDPAHLVANARRFSVDVFVAAMQHQVRQVLGGRTETDRDGQRRTETD
jgi:glycosyltransferase involved in cell wall biosynthesis